MIYRALINDKFKYFISFNPDRLWGRVKKWKGFLYLEKVF